MNSVNKKLAVLGIFGMAGACASALPSLGGKYIVDPMAPNFAAAWSPWVSDVALLILVIVFPSFAFALMVSAAARLCWGLQLIPQHFRVSWKRILGALVVLTLILPVGAIVMFMTGTSIQPSRDDSGNPNPVPDTPFQHIVREAGIPLILFVGAISAVLMSGCAVLIATGVWPPRLWAGGLIAAIGVPALTIAVAWLGTLVAPGSIRTMQGNPFDHLLADVANVPLLLILGEPVLAAIIGHWFYQNSSHRPPASLS